MQLARAICSVLSAAGVSLFRWVYSNTDVAVANDASNANEVRIFSRNELASLLPLIHDD